MSIPISDSECFYDQGGIKEATFQVGMVGLIGLILPIWGTGFR